MPCIAFVACQKPDGNTPMHKVPENGATELHMIGDLMYNDGAVTTVNGVTPLVAKFGDANNTVAKCVERFTAAYGRSGRPQYKKFWQYADAGALDGSFIVRAMEDDHDFAWNNNDHKLATFKGAFNVAAGTSTTDTLAMTDVRDQWRLGQTACGQIRAAYFRNKINTVGNGDIPQEMVGVSGVTSADFTAEYNFVDYDANLKMLQEVRASTATPPAGTAVRVIVPDCKRYTDPADKTDNGSKTMLGATQEAWLRQCIIDGQAASAGVTIAWTKDIFNRDNGDGGVGFRTYFDALLLWIHTNNYAVDHITGDRHNPHAGIARTVFGASYDATTICCCPAGQGTGGLTQYPENIMSYAANDANVVGTLELDMVNKVKYLTMRDFFSWDPICQVRLKFGERVPTLPVYVAKQFMYRNSPGALRTAYSAGAGPLQWPASAAAWTNTMAVPVQVTMAATSITAMTLSVDGGVTFDDVLPVNPSKAGQWIVPPGGQLKPTYTGITAWIVTPIDKVH